MNFFGTNPKFDPEQKKKEQQEQYPKEEYQMK